MGTVIDVGNSCFHCRSRDLIRPMTVLCADDVTISIQENKVSAAPGVFAVWFAVLFVSGCVSAGDFDQPNFSGNHGQGNSGLGCCILGAGFLLSRDIFSTVNF